MSATAPLASAARPEDVIEATDLCREFGVRRRHALRASRQTVKAVDGVSFTIRSGETYSLVGETGCGKTTITRLVLAVLRPTSGRILFEGKDIFAIRGSELREYRSAIQAVFQDPWSSMNPRMRIESIIAEPLRAMHMGKAQARRRVDELLDQVGLPNAARRRFPHEFSGGQRQRIAIARALAPNPRLIVLDEPVSALDVSIRAQIMNLLCDIQERTSTSYLLVAHDLASVRYLSHRVGVLYLGSIVEEAGPRDLFDKPLHPYTQALVAASLSASPDDVRTPMTLEGEVPSPVAPPSGCRFHPRCPIAIARCADEAPPLLGRDGERAVACHLC